MPEVKDKMTGKTIATMPYDAEGQMAAQKMVSENPGYEIKDGSMRSQQMYEGGGMTGMSMIGKPQYKEGGKMKYMGGGKMDMKYGHGGMTPEMMKYEEGGKAMKSVDAEKNPGLSKLPKEVRNKMGYMKKGGKAEFKPHMMYKDGKSVKANSYEKHLSLKKQGYGHSMKKMKEGGKAKTYLEMMRENVAKQKANIKKGVSKQKTNIKKSVKEQKKFDVDSGIKNQKKFDVDSGVGKTKKPAAKKRTEFQSAFRKARSEGKKNFTFKGKKYNTKLRK